MKSRLYKMLYGAIPMCFICQTPLLMAQNVMREPPPFASYPGQPEGRLPPVTIINKQNRAEILRQREPHFITVTSRLRSADREGNEPSENSDWTFQLLDNKEYVDRDLETDVTLQSPTDAAVIVFGWQGPSHFFYAGCYQGRWQIGEYTGDEEPPPPLFPQDATCSVPGAYYLHVRIREDLVTMRVVNTQGETICRKGRYMAELMEGGKVGYASTHRGVQSLAMPSFSIHPIYHPGEWGPHGASDAKPSDVASHMEGEVVDNI